LFIYSYAQIAGAHERRTKKFSFLLFGEKFKSRPHEYRNSSW